MSCSYNVLFVYVALLIECAGNTKVTLEMLECSGNRITCRKEIDISTHITIHPPPPLQTYINQQNIQSMYNYIIVTVYAIFVLY